MLRYIRFLWKCSQTRFQFFSYPSLQKAKFLAENNLSFLAGIYYLDSKEYTEAASCFEKAGAYKHLIIAYQKQGLYGKAITLADQKKYYERGAAICLHIHDYQKAAYFYSYFNPLEAAKLYKQEYCFYEAGYAYLYAYNGLKAIDCFRCCKNPLQKEQGLKEVAEFALVLYFTKQYEEAFELFIKLNDYYSALECAKKLKEDELIKSTCLLIGMEEAEKKHYSFAAKCVEPFDTELAMYYYSLDHAYEETVRLLLTHGDYEKALHICLLENDLNRAYEIASTYNPTLLSS
ncbi:hypothetical protein QTL86_08370 [Cellulosilyticum sp. ST5]|uniref:hypothetical protein n=1 Tax=unclassified Cellulosilyticum TaxID=2643091 RepID=UPI000F8D6088|nr:hypothetical protein [Cellulosilyticum sp. WCF-2]QEH68964.1 hypothetical protein EKH84_11435 [Cellulosilyticum sp. WCF-2]